MSDEPRGYVNADYLRQAAALFTPIKHRSHRLLNLSAGCRVLDLGCGTGVDLLALGEWVGPTGLVVGVDQDQAMAAQAAGIAEGGEQSICAVAASGQALPFADALFHGCRAERVFMHLPEPARVLAEMIRVVRPGGRVVVAETDWASCSLDCEDAALEARLNRFRAEQMMHGGYAGRQLYRLFRQAGVADLHCEVVPLLLRDRNLYDRMARLSIVEEAALAAGVIDQDELHRWRETLARAAADDSFFATVNVVMVAGRCSH